MERTLPSAQRGAEAFPLLLRTPLELPVSGSYIYWEIDMPRGSSFKPPRKHNGGGAAVAWATIQTPGPFWKTRGDSMGEKAQDTGAL